MTKQQVKERRTPCSVDEAAQMLISDFLSQHLQHLSRMTDEDLERLCRKFLPQIQAEFAYTETEAGKINAYDEDSLRLLLDRMKDLLSEFRGLFILT